MINNIKIVRIFDSEGTDSVPAILIPAGDQVIVIEQHPNDFGRQRALNGSSRVYFLRRDHRTEETGEAELSAETRDHAQAYVQAVHAFQALASPLGLLQFTD